VLQVETPAALTSALSAARPISSPPAEIAIGVPAEALCRRPDVRAAERRIAAQAYQADAARARLYPRFSLAGSIGLETLDVARLFFPGASFFRFSPSASWNVFDRRQLKQNVLIADERTTQASLDYEAVVLRALREVEDALATYDQEQIRSDRLAEAVAAAHRRPPLRRSATTPGSVTSAMCSTPSGPS
jgi:outer membrane protein, multidrug efflux system